MKTHFECTDLATLDGAVMLTGGREADTIVTADSESDYHLTYSELDEHELLTRTAVDDNDSPSLTSDRCIDDDVHDATLHRRLFAQYICAS